MLKLDCVNISYGAIQAVRDVSLEIPKGQVVTIIGANGAGKSTLLKSVVGLEPVVTGRVFLEGKDMTSVPAHKRTKLGVALSPEGRGVFSDQTVQDNLLLGAYAVKDGASTAAEGRAFLQDVPEAARAPGSDGWNAFRRRAADARHRASPDVRSEAPAS